MHSRGNRSSVHGITPQVHQFHSATPPSYGPSQYLYDQAHATMPPPPPPQHSVLRHPPRLDSRRPSNDLHEWRAPADLAYDDDSVFDPYRTIRPQRTTSRAGVVRHRPDESRSATYYRDADSRYPGSTLMIERSTHRDMNLGRVPSRVEKTARSTQEARAYQDKFDSRAYHEPDLAEKLDQLQIEPPSPRHRRPSQSQSRHARSRSRATSSISRTATDISGMRLTMEGNAVQIEGYTGDRSIEVRPGDDGQACVTIAGPPSPCKSRDKKYFGGGSQRSRASYDRTGVRTGSNGSATDR